MTLGSLIGGVLSMVGAPLPEYYYGLRLMASCVNALWLAYGLVNIVLGLNRLAELANPSIAEKLFAGN